MNWKDGVNGEEQATQGYLLRPMSKVLYTGFLPGDSTILIVKV